MADETLNFMVLLKQHHLYGVVVAHAVVVGFLIQLVSRTFPYFGWAAAMPIVREPPHLTLKDLINVAVNAASRKP